MAFFPHRKAFLRAFTAAATLSAFALTAAAADPDTNPLSPESFTYRTEGGLLIELTALADNAVRVRYTPNKAFSKKPELILTNAKPRAFTDTQKGSGGFRCTIGDLAVRYLVRTGDVDASTPPAACCHAVLLRREKARLPV